MPKNEDEFVKTIDGGKTKYRTCIGYCYSFAHKGFLTENIAKQHQCLERNCNSFCKIENSEYWKKKARKDEKRKEVKDKNKLIKEKEREISDAVSKYVDVIICKHLYDSTYMIIINENAGVPISEISKSFKVKIYLKKISEKDKNNIECLYLSHLPENMKRKAIEYKNDRKRRH